MEKIRIHITNSSNFDIHNLTLNKINIGNGIKPPCTIEIFPELPFKNNISEFLNGKIITKVTVFGATLNMLFTKPLIKIGSWVSLFSPQDLHIVEKELAHLNTAILNVHVAYNSEIDFIISQIPANSWLIIYIEYEN